MIYSLFETRNMPRTQCTAKLYLPRLETDANPEGVATITALVSCEARRWYVEAMKSDHKLTFDETEEAEEKLCETASLAHEDAREAMTLASRD